MPTTATRDLTGAVATFMHLDNGVTCLNVGRVVSNDPDRGRAIVETVTGVRFEARTHPDFFEVKTENARCERCDAALYVAPWRPDFIVDLDRATYQGCAARAGGRPHVPATTR